MKRANRSGKHGFTLMEVLTTVGILVILSALFSIPLAKYAKELRQKELDDKAELIFTTVQNQMTKLRSLGKESTYANETSGVYKDFAPWGYADAAPLSYVTSNNSFNAVTEKIFPDDSADAELRSGSWIIEFEPASGSVYAVFYVSDSEELQYDNTKAWNTYDKLRSRNQRLEDGARVGYYSGNVVEIEDTGALTPKLDIINMDILQATVTCDIKGLPSDTFKFEITITGTERGSENTKKTITISGTTADASYARGLTIERKNTSYIATLTIDKLEDDAQFKYVFPEFEPGCNISISAKVTNTDNSLIDAGSTGEQTVNSLFESLVGSKATIKHARHLQNLNTDFSGLDKIKITEAVQNNNIEFKKDEDNLWYSLYGEKTFKPIVNESLTKFTADASTGSNESNGSPSSPPIISDITIDAGAGNAGLFASISNDLTVKNVFLLGADVKGSNVGALVGNVGSGVNLTLDGCRVYLSQNHLSDSDKKWLVGENVGGLIGNIESGADVDITSSLAATVCEGENVGGLIGKIENSTLDISTSYADCYLYGKANTSKLGGLIGSGDGETKLKLTNSYAAGLICGKLSEGTNTIEPITAGIAVMPVDNGDTIAHFYTACASFDGTAASDSGLTYIQLTYATVESNDNCTQNNVFYLNIGSRNVTFGEYVTDWTSKTIDSAIAKLDSASFAKDIEKTTAYNLKVSGLGNYTYPKLKDIHHYGDWRAEFESGALIYYEKYSDGTSGFNGSNEDTLKDDVDVTEDGYGVVYDEANQLTQNTTITVNGKEYILDAQNYETSKKDEKIYYIYPLKFKDHVDVDFEALPDGTNKPKNYYFQVQIGSTNYYYNPHFANTAKQGNATDINEEDTIIIRTARQLNNLSLYYENYCTIIGSKNAFAQERDIDYATYTAKKIESQAPIGVDLPFYHSYNGYCYTIKNITFKKTPSNSDTGASVGVYNGLFGTNGGTLRNIVLLVDINEDNMLKISAESQTGYIGTLAGYNSGTIDNCAVSGYIMEAKVYGSGTIYAGGLVGFNNGTIKNSSATLKALNGASTYSTLYVGGMVGINYGQVRKSYAVGAIKVDDIKESDVVIAGFAASNGGTLRESYCAVSIISANAVTNGFSASGGNISSCYYLNGGTYAYCGNIAIYNSADENAKDKVEGVNYNKLHDILLDKGFKADAKTENEYEKNNTGSYPFPGIVTDAILGGEVIHYGAWPTELDLGTFGMFYWEKEEGGANAGYHFSYTGFKNENGKEVIETNQNLCVVHDDGGVITEYGYGYYWKDGNVEPTISISNTNIGWNKDNKNVDASNALTNQVDGYELVAYTTGTAGGNLRVTSERNQTWTLTQGSGNSQLTLTYEVSPFFGNAFTLTQYKVGSGWGSQPTNTNKAVPGSESKAYEIRSIDQLQYINWSYYNNKGSVTEYVTSSSSNPIGNNSVEKLETTYRNFPYLQYATVTGQGIQKREDAESYRTQQSWNQTHDLNGANSQYSEDYTKNKLFHPIAGAVENMCTNTYNINLYAWFGGIYDGQNYYIKNINIDSYAYNVGLFGTTAGAKINNIILYSDNGAVIQRRTEKTTNSQINVNGKYYYNTKKDSFAASYALGGLVGIAYDYANDKGEIKGNSTISNCAIAGYKVVDNSQNRQVTGEAVVGGLIGVSSVNLKQCSAVVDIEINCTHRYTDNKFNYATYGNFIRVGGLVGGLRFSVTDCYTGGSITVSEATLNELNVQGDYIPRHQTTYVYIGGIGGSGFSSTFQNFVGKVGAADGKQIYTNCYMYMDLPNMEGTITGIALIGSTADRYGQSPAEITITNCYYLDSVKKNISFDKVSNHRNGNSNTNLGNSTLKDILKNKDNQENMLSGQSDYLENYIGSGSKYTVNVLEAKTYAEMQEPNFATALGDSWSFVTKTEGDDDHSIDGKYSFPGESEQLLGQNYPFPTILKQGDNSLHYGRWTQNGLYWSIGIDSMDIITESEKELKLIFYGDSGEPETAQDFSGVTFEYSKNGIVEAECKADGTVTLTALDLGTTTVTAKMTIGEKTYTAKLVITVSMNMVITTEPEADISLTVGGAPQELTITVRDKNGNNITNKVTCSFESSHPKALDAVRGTLNKENVCTLTAKAPPAEGETVTLTITVIYEYNNKNHIAKTVRPVEIKPN